MSDNCASYKDVLYNCLKFRGTVVSRMSDLAEYPGNEDRWTQYTELLNRTNSDIQKYHALYKQCKN